MTMTTSNIKNRITRLLKRHVWTPRPNVPAIGRELEKLLLDLNDGKERGPDPEEEGDMTMKAAPFIHGPDLGMRLDQVAYYQRRNGLLVIGLLNGVEVVVDDEATAAVFLRAFRGQIRPGAGPGQGWLDEGAIAAGGCEGAGACDEIPGHDRLIFGAISQTSPVVKGTGVTVDQVIALITNGWTWHDIMRAHPELAEDDIRACLRYSIEGQPKGRAHDEA